MARQITIIDGHPDPSPERLCHALADAYADGAQSAGHEIARIRLADLPIEFLRTAADFRRGMAPNWAVAAQKALLRAEHIVLIYPLWLGTMPAMLKAFLEQVLRESFALESESLGWPKGRLAGRSGRVVVTMAMPSFAYRWIYRAHSLKSLERNILGLCGIKPIRETLLGMAEMSGRPIRKAWMQKLNRLGAQAR